MHLRTASDAPPLAALPPHCRQGLRLTRARALRPVMRYELTMPARRKTTPEKKPLVRLTVTVTPEVLTTLARLAQEATDTIGRPISPSAVLRALVASFALQPVTPLLPYLEAELTQGRLWGTRPRRPVR